LAPERLSDGVDLLVRSVLEMTASRFKLKKGLFLGYSFVGFVCYLVMISLGEMAAFLPHKKGFAGYATRFVDPALGFALGWNYLLKYVWTTRFCFSIELMSAPSANRHAQ